METIPWISITAASGGWTLLGVAIMGVLMGYLVPKWVFTIMEKRVESLETENKLLREQNAVLLTEGLKSQNAVLDALRQLAVAKGEGPK